MSKEEKFIASLEPISEYEEICNGKTIDELEIELQYQYDLGYTSTDSFPAYLLDRIKNIKRY